MEYEELFRVATGHGPYPWQRTLADTLPSRVEIPTGLGKTAGVVLGWLWRRRFADEGKRSETPRRLVYCLPMRVLVEQTRDSAILWLHRLGVIGGLATTESEGATERVVEYRPSWEDPEKIVVSVLMGGEEDGGWDLYPERDGILVGTQDMLLSRALNRGYGMSRYRWPMHFGLLNDDCLWVADEVQLMGAGLATTSQMQAFRRLLGTHHPVRTLWMSATMAPEWLKTVDVDLGGDAPGSLALSPADENEPAVARRLTATKRLAATARMTEPRELANEIVAAHRPGTRTLVVVNTVKRAAALYEALGKAKPPATPVLVHSRFRPQDRKRVIDTLLTEPGAAGTIVVSTQVIEAGVDVSSATLFTEVAPWASLVQRFGRCNRGGEHDEAVVYWIDLPADEKLAAKEAKPYDLEQLREARELLVAHTEVGPAPLPRVTLGFEHGHVVRRRDLVELFDTTPDLAGHDVDVSRFIREANDTDVQVFWRDVPDDGPDDREPQPRRDELCAVPLADIRDLVGKKARIWVWDALGEAWQSVAQATPIYPGVTLMLAAAEGRYTHTEGWKPTSRRPVTALPGETPAVDSRYSAEPTAERSRMTLVEHTDLVVVEVARLVDECHIESLAREALLEAARWHDAGKAHPVFQRTMYGSDPDGDSPLLAKTDLRNVRHKREVGEKLVPVRFRHELVSGLLALQQGRSDLVAYLAAAHHGKVRLSIRSLPQEPKPPEPERLFARGVWDGDPIPEVDLGDGITLPATTLDLAYMELGQTDVRGASWLSRMLALRDDPSVGPFRLGLLEAIIKAADERASGGGS